VGTSRRLVIVGLGLGLAGALSAAGQATAAALDQAPAAKELAAPAVGVTLLAGLAAPTCSSGQAESCAAGLDAGPSVQALVLFRPSESWSVGVVGQLARAHWRATYLGMVDGAPHDVQADLTTGFVGLAARVVLLPTRVVSPVVQLALASAFQTQTGSNFGCNDGLMPTGQLALGGRARVSPSFALFALASASGGVKLAGDCAVSDGPPATPFAGWGYGLHVGASFDLAVGGASASLAAR
jgi:hypothetical protein